MPEIRVPETSITIDGVEYSLKQDLTIEEKYSFIKRVVDESIVNYSEYSRLHRDIAFDITFLDICTNFDVPTAEEDGKDVFDSQSAADLISRNDININNLGLRYMSELRACVTDALDFEKQKIIARSNTSASDEAIEAVSSLAYKGIELVNKAIDLLETNGAKLGKVLTKKRVNEFISSLQNLAKMNNPDAIAENSKATTNITKAQLTLVPNQDEQ